MDKLINAMKSMSVKYEPKKNINTSLEGSDIIDKAQARKLANQYSIGGKRINSSSEMIQAVNKLNKAEQCLT